MKVLINGGGVSGLAAARALLADGHDVEVFERAPALRTGGAWVAMWPNGMAVLEQLGVRTEGMGHLVTEQEARSRSGRHLGTVSFTEISRRLGTRMVALSRDELVARLAEGLPDGVLKFGAVGVGVSDGSEARLMLADGREVTGDLVIGADGHHSLIRRRLWASPETVPTGWVSWQGRRPVRWSGAGPTGAVVMYGRPGFAIVMPAGEGKVWCSFSARGENLQAAETPVPMLRERFRGYVDPVPSALAELGEDEVSAYPHFALPIRVTWGRGRITLMGDAAHVMPPSLGQGANQALEDAVSLARALRSTGDVTVRLRRYEQDRARRIKPVAKAAKAELGVRPGQAVLSLLTPDRLATATATRFVRRSSATLSARHSPEQTAVRTAGRLRGRRAPTTSP